ncbi:MAG: 50S ribosomal protein L3 [Candidatus Dadabacteria bacterium]|nr:MAG: 50S ribosomal protein L3 [Candidatus Dadabacteria bacterium]
MTTEKVYPEGLIGKKIGMTQIFTDDGSCVPVTVLRVGPCYVTAVKTREKDGYSAVQLGIEPKKQQRVNKAMRGHFAKAGKGAFYHVREVRCDVDALGWGTLGQELKPEDVFEEGEKVDVTGYSIGRGFSGVVRRFGVRGQPATRGTHEARRNIGSVGCRKFPGRIWKNQKMPGHMGNAKVTVQNLKVMGIRPEENVVLVKGAVPGAKGSLVIIRRAVKGYKPRAPKTADQKEAA